MALLWKEDIDVQVVNYSLNHIFATVKGEGCRLVTIIGFYSFPEEANKHLSWALLSQLHGMGRVHEFVLVILML